MHGGGGGGLSVGGEGVVVAECQMKTKKTNLYFGSRYKCVAAVCSSVRLSNIPQLCPCYCSPAV